MWKGTTDILNAKPTRINIIPNVKPYWLEFIASEIIIKFVEPEKPYIKEQPYNNNPDDKALNIKYFNPASDDLVCSLLKEAKTYKARDCSSRAIKKTIKSLELIITIIPKIEQSIKIGYSILNILNNFKYLEDIIKTKIPEISVKIFIKDDKKSIL